MTIPSSDFRLISLCYGALASIHGLLLLVMLVTSLHHQAISFDSSFKRQRRIRHRNRDSWIFETMRVIDLVFGERGLLGIKGKYFEVVYIVREIMETTLQSIQAYRMSQLVPRVAVNRFFVIVIVSNCWSTPILHHLFAHNPPLERLLCLVLDIALDFTSAMGVPVFFSIPYWKQYDVDAADFSNFTLVG